MRDEVGYFWVKVIKFWCEILHLLTTTPVLFLPSTQVDEMRTTLRPQDGRDNRQKQLESLPSHPGVPLSHWPLCEQEITVFIRLSPEILGFVCFDR